MEIEDIAYSKHYPELLAGMCLEWEAYFIRFKDIVMKNKRKRGYLSCCDKSAKMIKD